METDLNISRTYKAWREERRTAGELNKLSRRDLNDLGISPYDIPRIAREAAQEKFGI